MMRALLICYWSLRIIHWTGLLKREREQWNALFENQYNKYRLPEENKEKYWKSRAIAMDFMFSWFVHMHCQHVKPPQIVRLSVTLFHYGVPQPVWRMLHKLKLCLSYEKTRQFMESALMQNTSALQAWLEERSRNCCFWCRQLCLLQSTIICSWRKANTLPSHNQLVWKILDRTSPKSHAGRWWSVHKWFFAK